jgi:hypothetical protein
VRVLNTTRRNQKLTKISSLAHCELVTLVTLPEVEQPQAQDSSPKFPNMLAAARSYLSNGEFHELEEFLDEYEDIFAVDRKDYGLTECITA